MIVVEPMIRSGYFTPGERVITATATELRLGPGTNYASLASVPANVSGVIVAHSNQLDGVLAKGTYWWKVSIGGSVGWLPQEALARPFTHFYEPFSVTLGGLRRFNRQNLLCWRSRLQRRQSR